MSETFGVTIRRLREARGAKAYEIADAIGRPASYVSDLELGKRAECPPPDVIHALADALGVSAADLLRAWGYDLPVAPAPAVTDPLLRDVIARWSGMDDHLRRFIRDDLDATAGHPVTRRAQAG